MVRNLAATMRDYDFDSENGDLAFCFMDLDCSREKEKQLREAAALALQKGIHLVVSNPCFELWFMCHFTESPRHYAQSRDLLKDISTYINGYGKSRTGIYAMIRHRLDYAIRSAELLEKRAIAAGYVKHTADFRSCS